MDESIIDKLLEAANFIHDCCRIYGCQDCPFLTPHFECRIHDVPDTWHIPEPD